MVPTLICPQLLGDARFPPLVNEQVKSLNVKPAIESVGSDVTDTGVAFERSGATTVTAAIKSDLEKRI